MIPEVTPSNPAQSSPSMPSVGAQVPALPVQRICKNCEWWDGGGEIPAKTATLGDCLNRLAPQFTTEPDFTCPQFLEATNAE
jgi:hypothetical protein